MIALAVDLLRSRRTLLLGICAGLLAVAIGYLALYPSFEEQLQTFADDLPDAYKALLGDIDLATPEGYIRSQVYSLIAPLLIAGAAIAVGSGLARAERDQTLAVLAVTPLPRRSLAGAWWLSIVLVAGAAAVTSAAATATAASTRTRTCTRSPRRSISTSAAPLAAAARRAAASSAAAPASAAASAAVVACARSIAASPTCTNPSAATPTISSQIAASTVTDPRSRAPMFPHFNAWMNGGSGHPSETPGW